MKKFIAQWLIALALRIEPTETVRMVYPVALLNLIKTGDKP